MKTCVYCYETKVITDFHKGSNKCKVCYSKYYQSYYDKNKYKIHLKNHKYYHKNQVMHKLRERLRGRMDLGIEIPPEPEACQICNTKPTTRALSLDHDHILKKARGYLCSNCNTALGLFKDNIDNLKKAITYLEQFKSIVWH